MPLVPKESIESRLDYSSQPMLRYAPYRHRRATRNR
jgi:hypothetical protein